MKDAIFHFPTDGTPAECEQIKCGHINQTYLITTDTGAKYVLQWVNQYVFPNVDAIMGNMSAISAYLRGQNERMSMISYIDTRDSKNYYDDGEGGCWRAYRFVDNSICLQSAETLSDFYESARAFGHFQYTLRGFPAQTLQETIVDFHNTPVRYEQLRAAISADPLGRAASVQQEIDFIFEREQRAGTLQRMRDAGELPVRVTHNDTKINNVLLDADTRRALCVIDLDTVMPGSMLYDYGDSIRFGASSAAEDETDLDKVYCVPELYEEYTAGFLSEVRSGITAEEARCLHDGAIMMTLECGMRFLTDYLEGDTYFRTTRPGQNLDRARTQIKLVADMENRRSLFESIIAKHL